MGITMWLELTFGRNLLVFSEYFHKVCAESFHVMVSTWLRQYHDIVTEIKTTGQIIKNGRVLCGVVITGIYLIL